MKLLIIVLFLTIVWCCFIFPWVIRASARRISDQISQGRRPGTVKLINRCISILSFSNNWITNRTEQDEKRIDRLRVMLDEMLHPHG